MSVKLLYSPSETKKSEHFSAPAVDPQSCKIYWQFVIILFPKNKSSCMDIFIENFAKAKVGHCSRTYLLSGKFLPRAKIYSKGKNTELIIKTLTHP